MRDEVDVFDAGLLSLKFVIEPREAIDSRVPVLPEPATDLSETEKHDLEAAKFVTSDKATRRVVDLDVSATRQDGTVVNGRVLVSVVPEQRVMWVGIALRFEKIGPEELLFLRRAVEHPDMPSATRISSQQVERVPGESFLDAVTRKVLPLEPRSAPAKNATIIEIRGEPDGMRADRWSNENVKMLYGLMTSDEGWADVPTDVAHERLSKRWTTRDYSVSIALDTTLLQVSRKPNDRSEVAVRQFESHGFRAPSFLVVGNSIPGLEFGGIWSMERAMARRLTVAELERTASAYSTTMDSGGVSGFLKSVFVSNNAARSLHWELADGLARVEDPKLFEIDKLDETIMAGMELGKRIETLKWWLGLADAGAQLRYQARMNNLVIVLTFVIATVEIVIAIIGS